MNTAERYDEVVTLPRAVRFPVELIPPVEFDSERLETWPTVSGRLEYVDGRLLFTPPCGDVQQFTVTDVVITLGIWIRSHPEFKLGTNEAGMRLRGATRAADAAIWRHVDIGEPRGRLLRVPPILAVEVAGEDEDESMLRGKSHWYLEVGVEVVWIVLPEAGAVIVIGQNEEQRFELSETIPARASLPGLTVRVDDLFVQIAAS